MKTIIDNPKSSPANPSLKWPVVATSVGALFYAIPSVIALLNPEISLPSYGNMIPIIGIIWGFDVNPLGLMYPIGFVLGISGLFILVRRIVLNGHNNTKRGSST